MVQRLLAIGECMIELSPTGKATFSVGYAGDTFNTAWYASHLAAPGALNVSYFSAVGDDALSRDMLAFMRQAGIEDCIATLKGASAGLYMIQLDNGERSFQYWRENSAARQMADHLHKMPSVKAGDIAYFSGITMAILPEAGRQKLLEKLAEFSAKGVEVVFDPNLRPRLWSNPKLMTQWTMKSAAIADLVLPSFEDEAAYFGDLDPFGTADRYLGNGSKIAVVKNGPDPVLVKDFDGDQFQFQPDLAANVVDTTAAGDSFNAAFLVEFLERKRIREAVRAGCALARHVVGHRGALVPVTKMSLVQERSALRA